MAQFKDNRNATTVWLKPKTKRSKRTGEEYNCYEGSLDIGQGKMLTFQIYEGQEPQETKGGILFPVQVRKWKGTPKTANKSW